MEIDQDLVEGLNEIGSKACSSLLIRACKYFKVMNSRLCLQLAEEARDLLWDKIHSGPWEDVSAFHRQAYGISQLLVASVLVQQTDCCQEEAEEASNLQEALKALDLLLLMAGKDPYGNKAHALIRTIQNKRFQKDSGSTVPEHAEGELQNMAKKTEVRKRKRTQSISSPQRSTWARDFLASPSLQLDPERGKSIERIRCPSILNFVEDFMQPKTPVILTGVMENWPALEKWKDQNYLRKVGQGRTVPVETGGNYLSTESGCQLMLFDEFLDSLQESHKGNASKLYLAQHQLFDQFPQLNQDILTPDYCSLVPENEEEEWDGELVKQAWLGPEGTVSPLHNDPFHNLLAQTVGSKFIRLYDYSVTAQLYPYEGKMKNNSQVDVKDPDVESFPCFQNLEYMQGILEQGEILYIPPKYWHYIVSLEISFSVSFWWGKRHV